MKVNNVIMGLIVAVLFSLAGCGSGGGDSGSLSSVTKTNSTPQIVSAPEVFSKKLTPYTYKVVAEDSDNDALSFSLGVSPNGMTINSATGVVIWTPSDSQGGVHDVSIQVSDGKSVTTQSYKINVETVNLIASKTVLAGTGDTIEVKDPQSSFYGATVTVPQGGLSADTSVTITEISNPSHLPPSFKALGVSAVSVPASAKSVATGSPSLAKLSPHKQVYSSAAPPELLVTIPYGNDETTPQLYTATDSMLTQGWKKVASTVIDPIAKTITASITAWASVPAAYVVSRDEFVNLYQDSSIFEVKGAEQDFWQGTGKQLLILHGVSSNTNDFLGVKDLMIYFTELDPYHQYKNILFYN